MEKYIIILLFIIIFILLFERLRLPKKQKSKSVESNSPKAKKEESSVVGTSKYIPNNNEGNIEEKKIPKTEVQSPKQKPREDTPKSSIPAQIPEEDLEEIFSEEINEDEEEELRAMRTPMEDDDFATGLSFDELNQVEPLLTKNDLSENEQKQATTIARKLEDTEFLDKIEEVLPQARQRISELLDRELKSPPTKSKEDFDIGDFV